MSSNEINIVLIITTKKYPKGDNWRNKKSFDGLMKDIYWKDLDFKWAELTNTDDVKILKQTKGFKYRSISLEKQGCNWSYHVFVVPCLNVGFVMDNARKGQYLDYVITTCSEGFSLDEVYLIAHDKDFVVGTGGGRIDDDFVKPNHIVGMNSSQLETLVKESRAYMFLHEPGREAYDIIEKLDKEEEFDEKMCDQLFCQVFGKKEMNDFFIAVDKNPTFNYLVVS